MRSIALLFAIVLGAAPAVAADRIDIAFQAQPATAAETEIAPAVRMVIARQIEALRQSDAKTAFSVASHKLRQQFATEGAYLDVVRTQFPAIASARIVAFGDLKKTSFGLAQMVQISDEHGQPWLVFFLMDKEKMSGREDMWRIANVVMVKLPATEV